MNSRIEHIESGFVSAFMQGYVASEWREFVTSEDIQTPRLRKFFREFGSWRKNNPETEAIEFGLKHSDYFDDVTQLLHLPISQTTQAVNMMIEVMVESRIDSAIRTTGSLPGGDRLLTLVTRLESIRSAIPLAVGEYAGSSEEFARWLDSKEGASFHTGYESLDGLVNFEPGQLVIVAGGPSVGKSALTLDILQRFARRGVRCEYMTLEMSPGLIRRRLIASVSGVPVEDIARRNFGTVTRDRLLKTNMEIDGIPLKVTSAAGWHIDQVADRIMQSPAQVLAIDYAGLIRATGRSRVEIVTFISNSIMSATVAAGKLTFLLSQLNRESARESRPPALYDLKDSGALEADAHVVLGLHCPAELRAKQKRPLRVEVLKNRDGTAAQFINLDFLAPVSRFEEVR